jgi:nucleoside-diphosphate-sugar epimerase
MRVFVAGASGAIGQPLIAELIRQGHTVTGMTRSEAGAQNLVTPAFARWLGALPPLKMSEQQARETAGDDAVYYGTKLSGASNEKAKRTFGFRPRRLQWLVS